MKLSGWIGQVGSKKVVYVLRADQQVLRTEPSCMGRRDNFSKCLKGLFFSHCLSFA